jgi:hypothetical protein
MIQIAMDAAVFAPTGKIQLHAQRDIQFERLGNGFRVQSVHELTFGEASGRSIGLSERSRSPYLASCSMKTSASFSATSSAVSN